MWTGAGLGQWIPIGYSWHWHPWVDWDSVCKYPLDIHGIGMTGTMWDPVFRVDWGNLQPIGYPWHWHPWVDWDPGQSSPFKADWDSVGQCEMDWDNAYPLDLHGIGIPG